MTLEQFRKAAALALSNAELPVADAQVFDGFGLPSFQPVYVTIEAVAKLIRYQCFYLDGTFDSDALDGIARVAVKENKFILITI